MSRFVFFFCLIVVIALPAQSELSGMVQDAAGKALAGVNIFVKGSFVGTTSNAEGQYTLADLPAEGILVFSMLGFETQELPLRQINLQDSLHIQLREAFNKLKAVTISAGNIEVSDKNQAVVLKPLDIVTTPGALGDVIGALNTLPGTAANPNDGRLFVRGGAADETAIFIDGLRLGNAYGSSLSGIPTRGRFSPQLFKGSFFSTGAYSAEYGQALSSVLSLNSLDFPLRKQTDLSLMSVGASLSHTQVWKQQSVTANLGYTNLQPYMGLVPQNIHFEKAPENLNGEMLLRQKFGKTGLLKAFLTYQRSELDIRRPEPDFPKGVQTALQNDFQHYNLHYRHRMGKKHLIDGGLSLSANRDNIRRDTDDIELRSRLFHGKIRYQYFASPKLSLKSGAEIFQRHYREGFNGLARQRKDQQGALFAEANYNFNSDLVARVGLRHSLNAHSSYLTPRVSLAYRLQEHAQVSLAYGNYVQDYDPARVMSSGTLRAAKAQHWVLNYQYNQEGRTLRLELFQKNYQQLLRHNPHVNTGGKGFARGFDLFYRSRSGVKNLDYWITYSFVDSKRHWRDFQSKVQPSFAPRHNSSVVTKYWLAVLNSQLGLSYSINDGYSYHNPNLAGEMQSKTRFFNSLNFSWSYLPKPNLILHFEVTNVLGRENIFGYQYSSQPNEQGHFREMAVPQSANRFLFLGLFYTLSSDKKANQLNNL